MLFRNIFCFWDNVFDLWPIEILEGCGCDFDCLSQSDILMIHKGILSVPGWLPAELGTRVTLQTCPE